LASVIAVCGVVVAATVTGCSSGQQAATAVQEPAVNGSRGAVGTIGLLDVQLQVDQTGDAVPPGDTVHLLFVATNQSPDVKDRLVRITSDVGNVRISGDTEITPLNSLIVGTAAGPDAAALEAALTAKKAQARVALSKPISNGLTYDFTFTFEKAGETTIGVPVSAATDAPRKDVGSPHGGGH
jgi:hypothetical protein